MGKYLTNAFHPKLLNYKIISKSKKYIFTHNVTHRVLIFKYHLMYLMRRKIVTRRFQAPYGLLLGCTIIKNRRKEIEISEVAYKQILRNISVNSAVLKPKSTSPANFRGSLIFSFIFLFSQNKIQKKIIFLNTFIYK